jgi:Cell division protein FtsI/penicillin-binding protein 2
MPNPNTQEKPHAEGAVRHVILMVIIAAVFVVYVGRLFDWQIVRGAEYAKKSLALDTNSMVVPAVRGEILDREGNVLAGNSITYSVKFNAVKMDKNGRNPALLRLLAVLEEQGEEWNDVLPIVIDENGEYAFKEDREVEIEFMKSKKMLDLQSYATVEECIKRLEEIFDAGGYSKKEKRNLLSLRYSMRKTGFNDVNPFVVAQKISVDTVAIINELQTEMPGVETEIMVTRRFSEDSAIASHVVGTTGAITEAQLEAQKEAGNAFSEDNVSGYTINDKMGQSGAERAFESELRGKNGKKNITSNSEGEKIEILTEPPVPGNTIQTTIDPELQKAANESLEKYVKNNSESNMAKAAAAVAIDVKTGAVLLSSSYPGWDIEKYYNDNDYYNQLVEDETLPLFDRALGGAFTPGSIFKPMVAIAALEEGLISPSTTFLCEREFEYYDVKFHCMGHHGYINVYEAIQKSCNVFFFQAGLRLGIEKINAYGEYFGLGQHTGIELYEEIGAISNKELYVKKWNQPWTEGNTGQAAFGQLDNMFTPMQLATYCAAIANNGVRYESHFLDKVLDYRTGEVIREYEPKIAMDAGISQGTMNAVKEGMRRVVTQGTSKEVFGNYEYAVCGKTGTAETQQGKPNHLTYIAYAPAEDPQIAVAVVMEFAHKGEYAQNVTKDILDAYFGIDRTEETEKPEEEEEPTEEESSSEPEPEESETIEGLEEGRKTVDGRKKSVGVFFTLGMDAPERSGASEESTYSEQSETSEEESSESEDPPEEEPPDAQAEAPPNQPINEDAEA